MERRGESLVPSQQVCLGLGSNLGDRDANLRRAVAALETELVVLRLSSVYDTAPVLVTEQ
ncbi:MAG: 2-amino-4-hydroxy-6-hydroxymethyldihydropteridine diphosphokinase, partial [Ktedonobacterales bacterium]